MLPRRSTQSSDAAFYWFHPYPHGLTVEQVYRGLGGTFVVKPKDDPIPVKYGDAILMATGPSSLPMGLCQPASMMAA